MKENDFDLIAPIYDRLVALVFGKSLWRAQMAFVNRIKPGNRVLILGGGSGKFLEALLKEQPHIRVDYVEASAKMLALSQKQIGPDKRVRWARGTQENLPSEAYEVIITHFFLDVFSSTELPLTLKKLDGVLEAKGVWLCADFRSTTRWTHRFLLWLMHRFFGVVSRLQARHLQDIPGALEQQGLKPLQISHWKKGLIFSGCFQKR